jgi:phospholipid N-methyltransferase
MDLTIIDLIKKFLSSRHVVVKVTEDNIVLKLEGTSDSEKVHFTILIRYGDFGMKYEVDYDIKKDENLVGSYLILYSDYYKLSPEVSLQKIYEIVPRDKICVMSFRDIAQRYLINILDKRIRLSFTDYVKNNYMADVQCYTAKTFDASILPASKYLCVYAINIVENGKLKPILELCDTKIPIDKVIVTKGSFRFKFTDPDGDSEEGYTLNKEDKRVGIIYPGSTKVSIVDKSLTVPELAKNIDQYYFLRINKLDVTKYCELETETPNQLIQDVMAEIRSDNAIVNFAFIPI